VELVSSYSRGVNKHEKSSQEFPSQEASCSFRKAPITYYLLTQTTQQLQDKTSMTQWAYAIVPLVGGLAFVVGGTLALYVDRQDVLQSASAPRPVWIRYTSQATFDLRRRPHWIFMLGNIIFGPCMMVSAVWQAALIEEGSEDEYIAGDLRLWGMLAGACAIAVAGFPNGNTLGRVVHLLTAGGLAVAGLNYSVRAAELAAVRGDSGLQLTRWILFAVGVAGAPLMIGTIYLAGTATDKLEQHERGETILTPDRIRKERRWEMLLAIGQLLCGIGIALVLMTAVFDVVHLEEGGQDAVVPGVASALGGVAVLVVCYFLNDKFYDMCQKKKEEVAVDEEVVVHDAAAAAAAAAAVDDEPADIECELVKHAPKAEISGM